LEGRQLLAVVAMYYNPSYVATETSGDTSNAYVLKNTLTTSLGNTVRTFNDFSPASLSTALTGADLVVIPRFSQPLPVSEIPATAVTTLRSFVTGGGGFLAVGAGDFDDSAAVYQNEELFSAVYGTAALGHQLLFSGDANYMADAAAGTAFASTPISILPSPLITTGLTNLTTGANVKSIYRTAENVTTVALFNYANRFSLGFLGFDFIGISQPGAWLTILKSAVKQVGRSTGPVAPAAPSGLTATAASTTQINLAWTDNSTNETAFRVDRATNSTFTTGLVSTSVAANATSLNVTGLAADTTYFFRVVALNGAVASSPSSTASAKTPSATPATPTGLAAAVKSATQIDLAWADNSPIETGYRVQRATNSTFTTGLITSNIAANSKTFSATGLTPNTTYYFRVYAVNGTLLSTASTTVSGKTLAVNAPTALAGTVASSTQINLAWTDNSTNETGFRVQRATNSTFTTGLVTTNLAANVKTLNATGLLANTTYYFRVYALNGTLLSTASNVVTAKTFAVNPPSALKATVVSATQINLGWTDNSTNETGFRVQRATNSAFTTGLVTTNLAANVKTLNVTGLLANTTYYFRAYALSGALLSPASATVSAKTPAASPPVVSAPAAPTSLVAVAKSSSRIDLAWKDNATNETGYRIERSTSPGGTWTTVATLGANATYYANTTGLSKSTTYYYRVVAILNSTASAPSNVASAKTLA
jgi:hypothetical protein